MNLRGAVLDMELALKERDPKLIWYRRVDLLQSITSYENTQIESQHGFSIVTNDWLQIGETSITIARKLLQIASGHLGSLLKSV